jgi:hypothetical protein
MTERRVERVADAGGPPWEKRGNAAWLRCPACGTWYPASPAMLGPAAPPCVCPACHAEFRPADGGAAPPG